MLVAPDRAPLGAVDLERLATAAHLLGRDDECIEALTRAHATFRDNGDVAGAARCAVWLGLRLMLLREHAQGSGWLARAKRMLDESGDDSALRGYLLLPEAIGQLEFGSAERGLALFNESVAIGERHRDRDLTAQARLGIGRSLIRLGRAPEGVRLLDEVMVAITTGEIPLLIVGDLYCSMLDACVEIFDVARAQEWTDALQRWCEAQPSQVPYRGTCLLRRSEILQVRGDWEQAVLEVERAIACISQRKSMPGIGTAHYQLGELHRLRGEFDRAAACYGEAVRFGRHPQPGLALLELARGDPRAALRGIEAALRETKDRRQRARYLGPAVEVAIVAGDLAVAESCCAELEILAEQMQTPLLRAMVARGRGSLALERGDVAVALAALRDARGIYVDLGARYEAARTQLLLGRALTVTGDVESAALETDAARRAFDEMGAAHAPAATSISAESRQDQGSLTSREREVLVLLATGATNRAIAVRLGISDKTVARHISNLFLKLNVSSRAAATAWAYDHDVVARSST